MSLNQDQTEISATSNEVTTSPLTSGETQRKIKYKKKIRIQSVEDAENMQMKNFQKLKSVLKTSLKLEDEEALAAKLIIPTPDDSEGQRQGGHVKFRLNSSSNRSNQTEYTNDDQIRHNYNRSGIQEERMPMISNEELLSNQQDSMNMTLHQSMIGTLENQTKNLSKNQEMIFSIRGSDNDSAMT